MKIKWLGHAAFLITSSNNIKIITDPYAPGKGINYQPVNEVADIVTISHAHGDHNNFKSVKGSPVVLREKGSRIVKGIEIKAVSVFHDTSSGRERGANLIFCFNIDSLNVCHAGDLGHTLSEGQINNIGPVDVLMLPVGGYFTIDAQEASSVVQSLKPRIVIPMHYKTSKADYPISGLQPFLEYSKNVRQIDLSEFEITREGLPSSTEVVVLKPAN